MNALTRALDTRAGRGDETMLTQATSLQFGTRDLKRLGLVLALAAAVASICAVRLQPRSCDGEVAMATDALEQSRARVAFAAPPTTAGKCELYRAHARTLAKFSAQSRSCLARGSSEEAPVDDPTFSNSRLAAEWAFYARVIQEKCGADAL